MIGVRAPVIGFSLPSNTAAYHLQPKTAAASSVPSAAAGSSKLDLANISEAQARSNALTGNIDYQRAIAQAERAEAHSAAEAQKNRDWQEYMSNTAYSRSVRDLQSVGINPYAIGSFNAASTPSGAFGSAFSSSSGSTGHNVVYDDASKRQTKAMLQTAYLNAVVNMYGSSINAIAKLF